MCHSSTIPGLQAKIDAVLADVAALTPVSTISSLGNTLIAAGVALNDSLPSTRASLVRLNYAIDHIVDFNLVKDLLLRVKVGACLVCVHCVFVHCVRVHVSPRVCELCVL
jgi:hypothetical protein